MARMPSRPGRYGTLLISAGAERRRRLVIAVVASWARASWAPVREATSCVVTSPVPGASMSLAIASVARTVARTGEIEVGADLAYGVGPVERVEVDAGRTRIEQCGGQLGGHLDTDAADLSGIVGAFETLDQPAWQVGAAHRGHPGHLRDVADRHDSRQHGLVDVECGQLVDEAQPVLDLEEELGDREVGHAELVGEMTAVGGAVG